MLDPALHAALAAELRTAERTRVAVTHFSRRHPTMTIDDSYAIQREWMKLERAEGRRMIGHKIGLTSRAMQIASQITEPDYGMLLDSMLLRDGSEVEAARYLVPRIEVEFAFILGRPLRGPSKRTGNWGGLWPKPFISLSSLPSLPSTPPKEAMGGSPLPASSRSDMWLSSSAALRL